MEFLKQKWDHVRQTCRPDVFETEMGGPKFTKEELLADDGHPANALTILRSCARANAAIDHRAAAQEGQEEETLLM